MTRSMKKTLFAAAFAALAAVAFVGPVNAAHEIEPPEVPSNLEVPEGHRPYRIAHAYGTQNQICLPRTNGVGLGWTFYGPQATLLDDQDEQSHTHYLSANPDENGLARATWQHSGDSSSIWAAAIASSLDPEYVEAGAIPWLLLEVVGSEPGPDGGNKLRRTTYIQRVNTMGGVAPTSDCPAIGAKLFVPYETDYVFYRAAGGHH